MHKNVYRFRSLKHGAPEKFKMIANEPRVPTAGRPSHRADPAKMIPDEPRILTAGFAALFVFCIAGGYLLISIAEAGF